MFVLTCSGRVYAEDTCNVRLHDYSGNVVMEKKVAVGSIVELPAYKGNTEVAFQGWSANQGTEVNPAYEAMETITVSGDVDLYAVGYSRKRDDSYIGRGLLTCKKYVIFVGDSRVGRFKQAIALNHDEDYLDEHHVVVRRSPGRGIDHYLKESGVGTEKNLIHTVQELYQTKNKKIAVVMCYGVNDLKNFLVPTSADLSLLVDRYIEMLRELQISLKKYHVMIYYLSVNPINSAINRTRREKTIRAFNEQMKASLPAGIRYIDAYHFLMREGFCTDKYVSAKKLLDDGLHYSAGTSYKVMNYVIDLINREY